MNPIYGWGILVNESFHIIWDEFKHNLFAEYGLDYIGSVQGIETVDPGNPSLTLVGYIFIFIHQDDVTFVFIKELFS